MMSWEAYRDVMRLSRKTRLAEAQRVMLWSSFSKVHDGIAERQLLTEANMSHRLEHHFETATHPPFEYCVIDEAQDIGVAELCFLAALGGGWSDSACASSVRRSRGARWAWTCAAVRAVCASTVGPPTRSDAKRFDCWLPSSPTWTALRRSAVGPSRRLTGRSRSSEFSDHQTMKLRPSLSGSSRDGRRATRRTKSPCSSDRRPR